MRFITTIAMALAACSIALPAGASPGSPPAARTSNAAPSSAHPKAYSIQPQTGSKVPFPTTSRPSCRGPRWCSCSPASA